MKGPSGQGLISSKIDINGGSQSNHTSTLNRSNQNPPTKCFLSFPLASNSFAARNPSRKFSLPRNPRSCHLTPNSSIIWCKNPVKPYISQFHLCFLCRSLETLTRKLGSSIFGLQGE